ncbi:MAG: TetR/AcrR family transcriptional regulator [Paracoccaceae bacterium]|nr:TetR/AcrR family transcriptional regulator [Paracoccaceae bacterium]
MTELAPTRVVKSQPVGRKVDQVIAGAREVFMRSGFEGASVDEIAREAGVSKATLYSYFSDKRLLFLEVAKAECQAQTETATHEIDFAAPVRDVLTQAATRLIRFFLSDVGQQVYRIVVAESGRFPEIGREFWESGPERVRSVLIAYFAGAVERGALEIDDLELAADQFPELCKARLHTRMAIGIQTTFTDEEIDRTVAGAVDMFLSHYGPKQK